MLNPFIPWRGISRIHGPEVLLMPLYALVFSLRCLLQDLALLRSGQPFHRVALEFTFLRAVRNSMWRYGEVADRLVPFSR